jgi:DNA-binding NtrC family response regulator
VRYGASLGLVPVLLVLLIRMRPRNALIVDPDPGASTVLTDVVRRLGLNAVHAKKAAEALPRLEQLAPAVVFLYLSRNDKTGLQLMRRLVHGSHVPVIAVVDPGDVRVAVEAMRDGAFDVVDRQATIHEIEQAVGAALAHSPFQSYEETFGRSPRMLALEPVVAGLAAASTPILVRGESGVGKEVIARAIHQRSERSERPFVKLALTALPADRVVKELDGVVAATPDGTLFLDEISEASAGAQTRLLDIMTRKSPAPRVIAATSVDLNQLVARGAFRRDLYQRLAQATVDIPPLRERREEIDVLTERFLKRFSRDFQRPLPSVSKAMAELLRNYGWPGNVRELESIVKRWVVLSDEAAVRAEIEARQAAVRRRHAAQTGAARGLREIGRLAAREAERAALQEAMLLAKGNRAAAARRLRVSYRTLLQKLAEAGLTSSMKVERTGQRPIAS